MTGAEGEIILTVGDIDPRIPSTMLHDYIGLLLSPWDAMWFSSAAIPLPAELDGADQVAVTVYFWPQTEDPGDVDFGVTVDAYDTGDWPFTGAFGADPAAVPVAGVRVLYKQEFLIDWEQNGTEVFNVTIRRELETTDTYPEPAVLHALKIENGDAAAADGGMEMPQTIIRMRPNPSPGATQIEYRLERPSHVVLTVVDVEGRVVERTD